MESNKCITTLAFRDGKKEVRRTLEGFVQLQEGDAIFLPNPIEDKLNMGTFLVGGKYKVQKVDRIYKEPSDKGCLEIKYFLSRLNK